MIRSNRTLRITKLSKTEVLARLVNEQINRSLKRYRGRVAAEGNYLRVCETSQNQYVLTAILPHVGRLLRRLEGYSTADVISVGAIGRLGNVEGRRAEAATNRLFANAFR
jgi:hypothetical protein